MPLNIESFNPTIAELNKIAAEVAAIGADRPLKEIKAARLKLRDVRIGITKKGKEMRDEANQFSKAVIAKEKELVAILEPQEARLQGIEDEAAVALEHERRKVDLPRRRGLLVDIANPTDDELLAMDDTQFAEWRNQQIETKNRLAQEALDADRRKLEAEKAELKRQQDLKDAEDRGRKEAAEKAERDRITAQQEAERKEAERIEREARDKRALEAEEAFQAWALDHGMTKENAREFEIRRIGSTVELWKKVGTYKPNQTA